MGFLSASPFFSLPPGYLGWTWPCRGGGEGGSGFVLRFGLHIGFFVRLPLLFSSTRVPGWRTGCGGGGGEGGSGFAQSFGLNMGFIPPPPSPSSLPPGYRDGGQGCCGGRGVVVVLPKFVWFKHWFIQ